MTVTVHLGDSMDVLKGLPDASIDSCCTDAPYALTSIVKRFGSPNSAPAKAGKTGAYKRASAGFMNQRWDTGETAHNPAFWAEVLRVLKPGAHLVAFSGTRTQHRQACAIEDAGFEIRDTVLDIVASDTFFGGFLASLSEEQLRAFSRVIEESSVGGMLAWAFGSGFPKSHNQSGDWEGWGSALKPAFEPVCVARKPMVGTIAANLAAHGVGALNIDGCRIEGEPVQAVFSGAKGGSRAAAGGTAIYGDSGKYQSEPHAAGRWPANVVHDGSDEVVGAFPLAPGQLAPVGPQHGAKDSVNVYGDYGPRDQFNPRGDAGSAARFFYTAKADATDRLGSKHPTVKPVSLMRWLCRLVTPPGGVVLDPFAGTGTTGLAAMAEGFDAILIEREADYVADIHRRIAWARGEGRLTAQETARRSSKPPADLPLFGGEAA